VPDGFFAVLEAASEGGDVAGGTRGQTLSARSFVFLALLAVGSCGDPTRALPVTGPPDSLLLSVGGFGTEGKAWSVAGDTLIYRRVPFFTSGDPIGMDSLKVIPSDESWREFWRTVRKAGVYRWYGRYVAENVMDGSWWSLRLAAGEFSTEATGSNAWPDRRGQERELEYTDEFASFVTALERLVERE
jgi:hypothetical protein